MSAPIPSTLGGYRIEQELGRGGMAVVYKAYDPGLLDRHVALKVLPAYFAHDPEMVTRFRQEANAIARLRHGNIIRIFVAGEQDGHLYLVMELLDGGTLTDRMNAPISSLDAATLLAPVAEALDYAHGQGILHRDIKPSNILFTADEVPILSDFGIAKLQDATARLTRTGEAMGTPEYMAPELVSGQPASPASDQYALAVVVYELLTGRRPFTAPTPMAVLFAHVNTAVPSPRGSNPALPEAAEAVLIKGLSKNPADRYANAATFVADLAVAGRPLAPPAIVSGPRCPSCGVARQAGERFCHSCGSRTNAVTPTPTASPIPTSSKRPPSAAPMPANPWRTVAPDGSGDFRNLEKAIQHARPGEELRLAAGIHRLARPLELDRPLVLVGAGMDQTRIVGNGQNHVLRFTAAGKLSARDLTIAHEGNMPASALVVTDGEISIIGCRFTGATSGDNVTFIDTYVKSAMTSDKAICMGLDLRGTARGVVSNCRAEGNTVGIGISKQAQPLLEENICAQNEQAGIVYLDRAAGTACRNTCSDNVRSGIVVTGHAQPLVEENTCTQNRLTGIFYGGEAAGTARRNICSANSWDGILVSHQAQPLLEENTCQENRRSGINYLSDTTGIALRNTCTSNFLDGIRVSRRAQPLLEGNICSDNGQGSSSVAPAANPELPENTVDAAPQAYFKRPWQRLS